jgi:hypothetical protein
MCNYTNQDSLTHTAATVATFLPDGQKEVFGLRPDSPDALAWRRYR